MADLPNDGCRPFWGSEICSGAEFVEVLSQKRTRNTHKKRHKNVFYSKTPKLQKVNIKIACLNNCVTLPRDFHS